jgi:plastocyanin
MKKILILSAVVMFALAEAIAATYTIRASGMSFTPDKIYVNPGDIIIFEIETAHDVVEVSEMEWHANGNTSNGGFSLPHGGGMVVLNDPGEFYYVCTPHASQGMKGLIIVQTITGFGEYTASRDDIIIYPNPVKDILNMEFKDCNQESGILEIVDVTGTIVYQQQDKAPVKCIRQVDVRNLSPGIYFAVFRHEATKYAKHFKFIRQ